MNLRFFDKLGIKISICELNFVQSEAKRGGIGLDCSRPKFLTENHSEETESRGKNRIRPTVDFTC